MSHCICKTGTIAAELQNMWNERKRNGNRKLGANDRWFKLYKIFDLIQNNFQTEWNENALTHNHAQHDERHGRRRRRHRWWWRQQGKTPENMQRWKRELALDFSYILPPACVCLLFFFTFACCLLDHPLSHIFFFLFVLLFLAIRTRGIPFVMLFFFCISSASWMSSTWIK